MYKDSTQKVKVFMIKMFTKTRSRYRSFSGKVVLRSCVAVTVPEYVSNEVSLQFYGKQTLMWVFSCEFVAYFWKEFLQEHIWGTAFDNRGEIELPNMEIKLQINFI